MENMKLYTKEQVKDAFIRGVFKGMAGSTISTNELFEMYISEQTPIELPSDEEINNQIAEELTGFEESDGAYEYSGGFEYGAKWMKEQIKQQDKNNS